MNTHLKTNKELKQEKLIEELENITGSKYDLEYPTTLTINNIIDINDLKRIIEIIEFIIE